MREYLETFLKRPILVEQEAQIVAAMIDGTINKNTAKELFRMVMEENLKKYDEVMNMNEEEIERLTYGQSVA